MRFLLITLITHLDPAKSTRQRFREVVDNAVLGEELGFDGYGVGERHERPFISSSPPVVLSHIAARTSRIRLFTAVTTLSLLDPVRAFEDYATLDNLADGRLELIIGKGNGAAQAELFHVTAEDQWDRNRESYELFRQLWRSPRVTWEGHFRNQPCLGRPGRAVRRPAVLGQRHQPDRAVRRADPLLPGTLGALRPRPGPGPRRRRVGRLLRRPHLPGGDRDVPADLRRPAAAFTRLGLTPVFPTLSDAIERSSILVGSPQQIIDKVHRYHAEFGHEVMHLHADGDGLTDKQHRATLELFQSDIAPELRRSIPSRPLGGQ
jgi:alkanesulfonate monooxygenase SsuD/methylene tetrahydromethanopterin reductase-like flavin-dependent oxidoreductase (luciferase family)